MIETDSKNLVTIIVLSYNNLDGVYETLDSIFIQDYPEIEIILADDGTLVYDAEKEALEAYINNNKRDNIKNVIYSHLSNNQGTVKNANIAISKSSGAYIKLLASEDVFSNETALSEYVRFMKENNALIAFGRMRGITKDGEYRDELLSSESNYNLLKSYNIKQQRDRLFARNFLPAPAAFFDRSVFGKCGLFDEEIRLIEDYPYWIKLTKHRIKFSYLDKVTIHCRMSGVSSAGSYSEMFMKDMFVIYNKYIFPYDKRFGIFQMLYNRLKRDGLSFYMEKARISRYGLAKRVYTYIRYSPFYLYTKMLDIKIELKNKRK